MGEILNAGKKQPAAQFLGLGSKKRKLKHDLDDRQRLRGGVYAQVSPPTETKKNGKKSSLWT